MASAGVGANRGHWGRAKVRAKGEKSSDTRLLDLRSVMMSAVELPLPSEILSQRWRLRH